MSASDPPSSAAISGASSIGGKFNSPVKPPSGMIGEKDSVQFGWTVGW
jgi:hypothetical protein